MQPEIVQIAAKKLVGMRLEMSMSQNKTFDLWSNFMPLKNQIPNLLNHDLISMEIFPQLISYSDFSPATTFEKWALVEVSANKDVPYDLEKFEFEGGLYAHFVHIGPASEAKRTFDYIFQDWLPSSGYELDHRPHFEVMGSKYQQFSADSKEDVYVPVRPKH